MSNVDKAMNTRLSAEIGGDISTRSQLAPVFIVLLVISLILGVYYEVTWSIVSIWMRSETYAHGFLIFPFSAYMIWKQRHRLDALRCQPSIGWVWVLGVIGLSWLLATLASVQIVEQYALIAMIPVTVCIIMGYRVAWAIAFPLTYLFFAVPVGDALIPPLIDFTADFTVAALQMTGVPVYREGTFFSIPSGNWSVVEACSGLRYLIASVTLGTLYAYLTYRSWVRRVLFIILSIIVPIIANGMRAYMIVMTGHLSDMQLAVGVDHLIYGWIFFGLVMILLFWIGSFWREDQEDQSETGNGKQAITDHQTNGTVSLKQTLLAASLVVITVSIWPAYAIYLESISQNDTSPEIDIADPLGKWRVNSEPFVNWAPTYVGEPHKFYYHFEGADQAVGVYITYYRNQNQGSELINSGNVLVSDKYSGWRHLRSTKRNISLGSEALLVTQHQLTAHTNNLLAWRWYWLGNEQTANPYLAKAILAINKLLGEGDDGAEIIVTAIYDDRPEEAEVVLQGFIDDMFPAIASGLSTAYYGEQ
ncbi:exosortase A [Nitrosomonas nitrosa]|uniref:Exosortase A n=1 Tax=Nitrosomonas nitrosa TaxID=52442 RepID=A0A1I4KWG5_9PROT|nr:exosortase A [Nitrosomonas nitrosa]SFL83090.1 exosortase A [Nitrosomonas nitrosa]